MAVSSMTSPDTGRAGEVRRKYRNVPTTVDGVRFASKAEAKRYEELKLLVRAGEISELELQKPYQLTAFDGTKLAKYVSDFDYRDKSGVRVTEDVKGILTPAFRIKAQLVKAQFGREITIIGGRR
jgi:hypothetical protein